MARRFSSKRTSVTCPNVFCLYTPLASLKRGNDDCQTLADVGGLFTDTELREDGAEDFIIGDVSGDFAKGLEGVAEVEGG